MGVCESKSDSRWKCIPEAIIIGNKKIDMSLEQATIMKKQKENSICLIEIIEEKKKGTGFLCSLPYLNNESRQLPVLITCNHVLNINEGKEIELQFSDKNFKTTLKIDENRKKYINKKLDITILEIKEEDCLNSFEYLEIDGRIFKDENLEKIFSKEIIYIIHYPQGFFSSCSYGEIKIISNNTIIYHNCPTQPGSSGAPILNLENNKVIGLHCGFKKEENLNQGLIFKEPLIQFDIIKPKNIEKLIKKEIILTLEITENDINKPIYFLDNSFFDYKNAIEKPHSFLSELNDSNVKIFIKEPEQKNYQKQKKYQKYFNPKETGNYEIKLEIYTKVTDCKNMFVFCNNITEIDLSNFDTSDVINMSYMFKDCERLEKLHLSYFSTRNVTNMDYMFYNCKNLSVIDLSFFDTQKVITMENMFSNCNKLEKLDLSTINTENVVNMKNIFSNCSHLTCLDLTSFDTKNVTDMTGMFLNCSKLKKIELSSSFKTNKVTSMKQMFSGCYCLEHVDLKYFNTKNVIDMSEMFSCCTSLTFLNLFSFDTRNVVNMKMMFNKCHDLFDVSLNPSTFVNDKVKDMTKMFSGCHSWQNLDFSHFHFKGKKFDNIFEDTNLVWIQNTGLVHDKK